VYEQVDDAQVVYTVPDDGTTSHSEVVLVFQIDSAQVTDGQEILVRCVEGDGTVFGGTYTNADIDVNETVPTAITGSTTISVGVTETATLDGLGVMTGSGAITLTDTVELDGLGALVGSATITFTENADIANIKAITGSTTITITESATLDGLGVITGSAAITITDPAVTIDAIGVITGATTVLFTDNAVITGLTDEAFPYHAFLMQKAAIRTLLTR
jgi:hypothetical protein